MNRQIRIALTAFASALLSTTAIHAAEIVVTSNTDAAVAGACTLRDAITAANTDKPVNGCAAGGGADTIHFQLPTPGPILLASSLPLIYTPIAIDGAGQGIEIRRGSLGQLRILDVAVTGVLDLRGITVADGSAPDDSPANEGGGLRNFGQATISDCTFRNNFAENYGGAIYNQGLLTVTRSAFLANRVEGGGGAIQNASPGRAIITNTTFSGNKADDQLGAAIANESMMSLFHCTIAENYGSSSSGIVNGGSLTMGNTIVARNTPVDCIPTNYPITAAGPNLIGDGSCAVAGAYYGDAKLDSLAANGGPTLTHALLEGSIAIDTASDEVCASAPVGRKDQRGFNRPSGPHCDLGAVERLQFTGFLAPVRNPPDGNSVKAGQAVPVKFSLSGGQGLDIFAPGYPKSQPAACVSGAPLDEVVDAVSAGGSTLTYDTATDTYTYIWKTDKSWKGCRQLIVQLTDGTFHIANFEFR